MYINRPWNFSGFSSAAGVIAATSGLHPGGSHPGPQTHQFRLHGFAVGGSTAVSITTNVIKLRYGDSSDAGAFTTITLCPEPGANLIGVAGLEGIIFGYAEMRTTVAHANGLTGMLWGA